VAVTAGLGGEHPDDAVLRERTDGIHQGVHQVAVILPPPHQNHVDDIVGILVEEVTADLLLDGGTHAVVDVLVPAKFLDDHPRLDSEPLGDTGVTGVSRGDHGFHSSSDAITVVTPPHSFENGIGTANTACAPRRNHPRRVRPGWTIGGAVSIRVYSSVTMTQVAVETTMAELTV
jgi:hypothetical protein